MVNKPTYLRNLMPGVRFRRATGKYRYVVSHLRDSKGGVGSPIIWCHNLDGESDGYWMDGNTEVVVLPIEPGDYVSALPQPSRFWMCYAEGAGNPVMKHQTEELARREAERIAKATGKRTYVLEPMACVDFNKPTLSDWIWIEMKEDD